MAGQWRAIWTGWWMMLGMVSGTFLVWLGAEFISVDMTGQIFRILTPHSPPLCQACAFSLTHPNKDIRHHRREVCQISECYYTRNNIINSFSMKVQSEGSFVHSRFCYFLSSLVSLKPQFFCSSGVMRDRGGLRRSLVFWWCMRVFLCAWPGWGRADWPVPGDQRGARVAANRCCQANIQRSLHPVHASLCGYVCVCACVCVCVCVCLCQLTRSDNTETWRTHFCQQDIFSSETFHSFPFFGGFSSEKDGQYRKGETFKSTQFLHMTLEG